MNEDDGPIDSKTMLMRTEYGTKRPLVTAIAIEARNS